MRRLPCPGCKRPVMVTDAEIGRQVQCDHVGCGRSFRAERPPAITEPAPVPRKTEPLLTGPHKCFVCAGEIRTPMRQRRHTFLHRREGYEDCRTDTYAAIYYCPHCRPPTLLETPSYQWGRSVTCPACEARFLAPRDDLLLERDCHTAEGVLMSFDCPSCRRELRCDSVRRGVPTSGTGVVCLHCHQVIEIPPHGELVSRRW